MNIEVGKYDPPGLEEKIRKFWKENGIFEKSVGQRKGKEKFVFLEGPPTANGIPHPGHLLTRTIKDAVLRYKAMNGYYIERKAGWDTHGLPVEIEVEKELGLKKKGDIEKYGIEKFNEECKKSVFKYEKIWKKMTERIGFWMDMENPYITLKNDYIESVWWSLKEIWKKGLLKEGYRVTPYCPRCGTTLSSHEVAQGYKEIEEPSIFIKFKLKKEDAYFLAWTTTPWTLISNVALAVNPREKYIQIEYEGEKLILAEKRCNDLLKGEEYKLLDRFEGEDLEGKEYEPLYKYAKPTKRCWFVTCADFVSMDEGTGIVHIAPAFGEDDYEVGMEYDLPIVQLVKPDGTFSTGKWKGKFVKDADESIIEDLKDRDILMSIQPYKHQYPFCWRCDSPLLYYATRSWFIKISKLKKELVKNNDKIRWFPSHLKDGRFGDFIANARDWSLSRKRYWGTPLPIWNCNCGEQILIGSVEELKKLTTNFPKKYDLHRPFVDEIDVRCPICGERMKRVEEVIDAWYDSGSAFFAQWHYPFEGKKKFEENFPADFICEAIDQTRGWFYSLLAISTLLFNSPSYKNVLSLGLILDKEGQKMSKRKKNYVDPNLIFENEGADAMRWFFISSNAPWSPKRLDEELVRRTMSKFLFTLWNSYSFFATYTSLDDFDPVKDWIPIEKRNILDRWIMSRLNSVISIVRKKMEEFELQSAAREIENFVIDDFSNWHIRCSRNRFWLEEMTNEKKAGYSTLYECLTTISKLIAPFTPFMAEEIYKNLNGGSVHLCDYPFGDTELINEEMENEMELARRLVELARSLRARAGIKVRHPLKRAIIIGKNIKKFDDILKEEMNVKKIEWAGSAKKFMKKVVKANLSSLGPKFKGKASRIAEAIEKMPVDEIGKEISIDNKKYEISKEDFLIKEVEKEGFLRADLDKSTLILDIHRTPELVEEGFAREIVRRIQEMRKEMDLEMEEKVTTRISCDREKICNWIEYVERETRSTIEFKEPRKVREWNINGEKIKIEILK